MGRASKAHPSIGVAFGETRNTCIGEADGKLEQNVPRASGARVVQAAKERVLQVVAKPVAERPRIGSYRQAMPPGGKTVHGRNILEGSNRRALAATTWPSSLAASSAATLRPCVVMR